MRRKPPARVVAIAGSLKPDLITQAELVAISKLQETEWLASRMAQQAVLNLEMRVQHGATTQPGELRFDTELRMVRSRKQKAGGE